jgi:phage recombination protein Bet
MEGNLAVINREPGAVTAVSDDTIASYLESFGNKLSTFHRSQFIQICKAFQLNPFIREVYGIPFGDKFNIIVGYEVYLKRAERSGLLAGWRAWTDGAGPTMKGCIEITRKDWTAPFYHEVYFEEYDQHNTMWKTKGRTMIKKVAIAQGFRMCFPEELGGMPYTADEMPSVEVIPPQNTKGKPEVRQPERKLPEPAQDGKPITESQKKLLFAKLKGANISEDTFKAFYNIASLSDLPFSEMNKALEAIKNGEIVEVAGAEEEAIPELCPECATPIINGACRNLNCPEGKPEDE